MSQPAETYPDSKVEWAVWAVLADFIRKDQSGTGGEQVRVFLGKLYSAGYVVVPREVLE